MEVAAATIMGGGGKDLLSVSELRTAMQQHLRQTGTLRDIKTQLRGVMLAELMRQRAVSGGRSTAVDEEDATSSLGSWCRQVADVLVENHLRGTQRAMTLSIFASEAEVSSVMPDIAAGKGEEAEVYLSQLLGVPCSSTHFGHVAKDSAVDGAAAAASSGDGGGSVLLRWVEQSLQRDAAAAKNSATTNNMTCSTQTPIVEGEHGFDADGRPLTSLECRLAAVDAKYAITYAQLRHDSPALSRAQVERKLAEYKQQMHEQLRREYQEKYRQYEATKLQEVKDALEERYAHLIACKSEELRETERAAVAKCEQEQERLRQGREELQRQRMSLDQRQREMHDMLHDHEVEFQAQVMLQRELKERIRQLQLQLAHWEEMCASHLMEAEAARQREARRVEDVVRLRSEHAAEMQIREEELARLRFRVRVLTNSALQHGRAAGSSANNNNNNNMVGDEEDAAMDQAEAYLEIQRTEALQKEIYERQQQQRAEAVQSGAMPASVGSTQPPLPAAWSRAWEAGQAHRHQAAVAAPSASSVAAAVADVVVGAGAQASPVPDAAPTTSPAEEEGHASSGAASTPSPPSPPPATEAVVMKPSSAASSASEPAKPASPTTKSSSASNQLAASVAAEDVVKDASTASAPVVAPEPSSPSLRTSAMRPDESLLTQGSGGSSLLALASRVIRSSKNLPSEHSSSSSSSSSSSARSSAAPPDVSSVKAAQDATKLSDEGNSSIMVDGERAREEQQRSCVEEEHVARSGMEAEEQTQRDGILWSQRSQWKVLQSQQSQRRAASTTDSDDEKPRDRAGGLLAQLEANRQRQQQGDGGGTQPIFRDDDSSDGDSVLFNDASTTSSF